MYEGLKPCPQRTVDSSGRILCGLIKSGDREVSVNLCRACPVPQINCQHLRASMVKKVSTPITVRYSTGRIEIWDDEPPTIDFKQAACAAKTMPIHSPRDCAGCPLKLPNVIPQNAVQVARRAHETAVAEAPAAIHTTPAPQTVALAAPPPPPIAQVSAQVDSAAAQELVQRAQAVAAQKAAQRAAASQVREPRETAYTANTAPKKAKAPRQSVPTSSATESGQKENKSKIILLQQWLADQFNKKSPQAERSEADPDVVSEITYSPIAPSYHEDVEMERCVGWTD